MSRRLAEELEAMDLSAQRRLGSHADAEEAVREKEESAIVFLSEGGAEIWMLADDAPPSAQASAPESSDPPVSVRRSPGESHEQAALRLAEHLRGRLLPRGKRARDDETGGGENSSSFGRDERVFSISTGPLLVVRSDANPALAWSLDAAFWLGRFGLGAFLRTALTPSDWRLEPKNFTVRETVGGIAGRFVLFPRTQRWETQLLLRAGWNASALRAKGKGMPEKRKEGTLGYVASEAGIESTYAVTSWLSLGGQVLGGFDAPVSWSAENAETSAGPAAPAPPEPGLQGHFILGALASARF